MNDIKYLTTKELSQRWKLNPNTIEHWRTNGFGPHFIKIGRKILYSLDSISFYHLAVIKFIFRKRNTKVWWMPMRIL